MNNFLDLQVQQVTSETDAIRSFRLALPNGNELPPFTAGSHVDVLTPGGAMRQYSLCNDPGDRSQYLIAVLQEPQSRGGSRSMHQDVHVGTTLAVSFPRNHFPLASANHTILLAGGIGITPLLGMAEQLSSAKQSFELHYCARSKIHAAFLERIRQSRFRDRVHCHFDDVSPNEALDVASVLGVPAADRHLYVCGPRGFIEFVEQVARRTGWPESSIHHEHFGGEATRPGSEFEVVIASTRKTYRIPDDRSVADVLNREGVHIRCLANKAFAELAWLVC
jgi:vanillate O-demethylase ferredoxin subunit